MFILSKAQYIVFPDCSMVLVALVVVLVSLCRGITVNSEDDYVSAVGDPGMRRDGLRLGLESWNQCNEVGEETRQMRSPRAADCFDLVYKASQTSSSSSSQQGQKQCSLCNSSITYNLTLDHKVTENENKLGVGQQFKGLQQNALNDVDLYAEQKEIYLGSKCQVEDKPNPWQFWMIMLKNGNMDSGAALCPKNGKKVGPFSPNPFPCFGKGCMNHPLIYHNYTVLQGPDRNSLKGAFYGSWDLDANNLKMQGDVSYYSVTWEKPRGNGSWVFHHVLRTSANYTWLMLYLRADATKGFSSGYHYPTRGMLKIIPESPHFRVKFTLNVIKSGGPKSQFYLLDIGSCWKNNGKPCDGNVTSDVTRYSEMILNPNTPSWCTSKSITLCPPYHKFPNGSQVHRKNTTHFPYEAYHIYCAPGNAEHAEPPFQTCDSYSNPQPQEILQLLPHPAWSNYGYPTSKGQGWIGHSRTWKLDVGRLSESLYFYQDPNTKPARRQWTSIDLGTEIFKDPNQVAEWTVSDFDVLVPPK